VMKVQVRIARAEELDTIAKIIREEIYPEISFEEMRERIKSVGWPLNPYVQWFLLEKEGEIIGAMRWEVYDRYAEKLVLISSWIAIKRSIRNEDMEVIYGRNPEK